MSTKLKGSLYIDDDIKLIYKDSMYKIFVDDHCTKYEIYDSGNAVTGYIRLFILNKETNHIKIINDIHTKVNRNDPDMCITKDNVKNELYLIQLLEFEEIKKSIYSYIDNITGY